MDIAIQKNTSVSLHQQLVTQISMQIASGLLKPGAKLPSIRALSKRLGIHHNTCLSAYKELSDVGLIEIRHGSGARVTTTAADQAMKRQPELSELDQLSAFFVEQVTRRDYPWDSVMAALEKARRRITEHVRQPLTFIDIHEDILPVFQAELQHFLRRPVRATTIEKLRPDSERDSHFVVSRYHCQALREKLKSVFGFSEVKMDESITMIDVGSAQQELEIIKQLPSGTLAAVVSESAIILRQAEAVVKALRGEEIYIRPVLSGQETLTELQRVLKRSQAIFADWICTPQLREMTCKPIYTIRTVPDRELEKLKTFQA